MLKKFIFFMIKLLIGIVLIWWLASLVLNTHFVSSLGFIQTMKKDTHDSIEHFTTQTKNQIIGTALDAVGFDYQKDYINADLNISPAPTSASSQSKKENLDTSKIQNKINLPSAPQSASSAITSSSATAKPIVASLPMAASIPNASTVVVSDMNATQTGFSHLSIPFFYDGTQAPKNLDKQKVLALIQTQSNKWTQACNLSFDYQGDKETDYMNNAQLTQRHEGIIKWGELDGDAIGEAHQGSAQGPAYGFVMILKPEYFSHQENVKIFLGSTILHEMGHIIGLNHSNNPNSIMFWQQADRPSVLNDTDTNMCRYFRSRWEGLSAQQASDKYGLIVNETTTAEAN
jgi:hypothetical protein